MSIGDGSGSQLRQNIGVHLRGNLRPNELAKDLPGQIRHAGFVLVLAVKLEGTAPVHGQGIGFLIHSNRALVETVVSVVITQTLHIQVRNQHVPRAYKFRSHGVIGQEACFRFLYQNFIQLPGQFRVKIKSIECHLLLSSFLYFQTPAIIASIVGFVVSPAPAAWGPGDAFDAASCAALAADAFLALACW